jgi:2-amino-4-hydroxy-6-hydroxymethyldihydropteridine diphosphokinase
MPDLQQFAFVALGSNLGDPTENVRRAMDRLQALSPAPLLRSSLWKSEPVDCPPGSPVFINAAAGLLPRPGETPLSLLRTLLEIETEFGRKPRSVRNEARSLDLDLLAFGPHKCQSHELTLPHPRAHLRRFVLAPLDEVAPGLVLPGMTRTVSQLLASLPSNQIIQKL